MTTTGRPAFAAFAAFAASMFTVSCVSTRAQGNQSEQALPTPQARQRIESADQLPLHAYRVATTARALFDDSVQFAALATQLEDHTGAQIGSTRSATGATALEPALAIENVAVIAMDGAPDTDSAAGGAESSMRRAIIETAEEKNIGPQKRIKLLDPRAALELIFR